MEFDFVGFVKYFLGAASIAALFYFAIQKSTESGLNVFAAKQLEALKAPSQRELEQARLRSSECRSAVRLSKKTRRLSAL
jgi:hypothetical protein